MIDDRNDPTRPLSASEYESSRFTDDRVTGWGLPALIGAIVLIGGLLLFGGPAHKTTMASNERAPATTNSPAPAPAAPAAPAQK